MTTDKISHEKGEYSHLFNLGERVEEMHKKEIEELILEVCDKDRDLQFGRKVAYVKSRHLSQDEQDKITGDKAATYTKKLGVILDSFAVACHAVSALAGQTATGGIFQAMAKGWEATSGYRGKITQGDIDVLTHHYQRSTSTMHDITKQMQDADKEHEQNTSIIDRITQSSQRLFEQVAGG